MAATNVNCNELVILNATTDANLGSQGSWVQSPHGFATVSEERFVLNRWPTAKGRLPGLPVTVAISAMGRRTTTRNDPRVRKPAALGRPQPSLWATTGANDAGEDP